MCVCVCVCARVCMRVCDCAGECLFSNYMWQINSAVCTDFVPYEGRSWILCACSACTYILRNLLIGRVLCCHVNVILCVNVKAPQLLVVIHVIVDDFVLLAGFLCSQHWKWTEFLLMFSFFAILKKNCITKR